MSATLGASATTIMLPISSLDAYNFYQLDRHPGELEHAKLASILCRSCRYYRYDRRKRSVRGLRRQRLCTHVGSEGRLVHRRARGIGHADISWAAISFVDRR